MTNDSEGEKSKPSSSNSKSNSPDEGALFPPPEKKSASTVASEEANVLPRQAAENVKMDAGSPAKASIMVAAPQSKEAASSCNSSGSSSKPIIRALPALPVNKPIDVTNKETVEFKVIFNKKKYDVNLPQDTDVGSLKAHLQPIIDIPPAMMKVMIKGLAKDEMTLGQLGVARGSKIMVVGSSLNDVLQVSTRMKDKEQSSSKGSASKLGDGSTCKQKQHKKVLDKGKPEDAMPGIKGAKESLPQHPISGMLNKHGGKVRLTFKLEADQLWIGTKERTEKLPLNSIRNVISESIEGHEEYHIVALQLGPTEASRYWIYWVPAQYVDSIKDAILGKWQFF